MTDFNRVMQLSRLCATLREMPTGNRRPNGPYIRSGNCSRSLKRSRSAADKNDRYSFLNRGFRCGNAYDTDGHRYIYTRARADRSKDARCQDRPAFEMIFGFGPDGTRIATSCSVTERVSKHCTSLCMRPDDCKSIFVRLPGERSMYNQSVSPRY